MSTLDEWKTNVGQLVMERLPGHDLESARALADAWLNDNGGWVPEDVGDPTGEGEPDGGETNTEVADSIRDAELAATKLQLFSISVTLRVSAAGYFSGALDAATFKSVVESDVQDRITETLSDKDGMSIVSIEASSGWDAENPSMGNDGALSQADKQAIQVDIAATTDGTYSTHAASGVARARAAIGGDNTWMATSVYTKDNLATSPVYIEMKKHTTSTYDAIDSGELYYYVISLGKSNHMMQSMTRRSA